MSDIEKSVSPPDSAWCEIFDQAMAAHSGQGSAIEELKTSDCRYSSVARIGEGGMKTIDKVVDSTTRRTVAMGRLIDTTSDLAIENFIREARITALLQHPNIVPVYDIGVDGDDSPYFTMKLLRGETLEQTFQALNNNVPELRNQFSLPRLLEIYARIVDAIAYAHSHGILHLDLKPANVSIDEYGEVLVCDWGLAKITLADTHNERQDRISAELQQSGTGSITRNGIIKGSPGYMAPEQATASVHKTDERTDIYSLGAILYSLLTYQTPVTGDHYEEVLQKTLSGRFEPPSLRRPDLDIPSGLEAVIMKAMACNPDDRYQSVKMLQSDIEAYTRGYATRAEQAGFFAQCALLYQRQRSTLNIIFGCLIIIGILVTAFLEKQRQTVTQLESQKAIADRMLNEYEAERTKRIEADQLGVQLNVMEARKALQTHHPERAMFLVTAALKVNPQHSESWELRGHLHLLSLEFDAAAQAYNKVNGESVQLHRRLCDQFSSLGVITESQRDEVAKDLYSRLWQLKQRSLVTNGLSMNTAGSMSTRARMELLTELVKQQHDQVADRNARKSAKRQGISWEIESDLVKVKVRPKSQAGPLISYLQHFPINDLDLSGCSPSLKVVSNMRLRELNISRTPTKSVRFLEKMQTLRVLNLRDTKITNLEPLRRLELVELNIQDTAVESLEPILAMRSLKTLWLTAERIPEEEIAHLRNQVDIKIAR